MNVNLHIDNRSLVEECLSGDREALNLFYTRFAPRMLGLIYRYVDNLNDAQDILHDGFIVAFTRLADLHDYSRVEYWLASIMKNLSLKFLSNQDVSLVLHQLNDIPDVEETPEIDGFLDLDVLEKLIKKMPSGYQSVFRLAVLEGKSHKEIGLLLGINPNTSSSQLFHAKLMMQKLVTEYRKQIGLLVMLLVLGAMVFFYYSIKDNLDVPADRAMITQSEDKYDLESGKNRTNKSTRQDSIDPSPVKKRSVALLAVSGSQGMPMQSAMGATVLGKESVIADSAVVANEKEDNKIQPRPLDVKEPGSTTDIAEHRNKSASDSLTENNTSTYYAVTELPSRRAVNRSAWMLGVGVDPGLLSFNDVGSDEIMASGPPSNGNEEDPDKENETRGMNSQQIVETTSRSSQNYLDYNNVSHHNHLPISFSLSVQKAFSDRLGLESGLTYTFLHSSFESTISKSEGYWHYLGIPVKLNFRTFGVKRLGMYATFGGRMDIPLYSNIQLSSNRGNSDLWSGSFRARVVWSLSASYGFSFRVSSKTDIFIEPTIQYHFGNRQPVPHLWSDNRWNLSLPIGFRFTW